MEERYGGRGALYSDRCCLEASVPHAQPVLHHPSLSNNQRLLLRAVRSLERARERGRKSIKDLGEKDCAKALKRGDFFDTC